MHRSLLVLLIAAFALEPNHAKAEDGWAVTESTLADPAVGAVLPRQAVINLPENSQITLFDAAASITRTCAGKYQGPIEDCPGPRSQRWLWWNPFTWGAGGVRSPEADPGGNRGGGSRGAGGGQTQPEKH